MELFDSQGRVIPISAADEGLVTKKVADQPGQRQNPPEARKRKEPPSLDAEEEKPAAGEHHLIDIVV